MPASDPSRYPRPTRQDTHVRPVKMPKPFSRALTVPLYQQARALHDTNAQYTAPHAAINALLTHTAPTPSPSFPTPAPSHPTPPISPYPAHLAPLNTPRALRRPHTVPLFPAPLPLTPARRRPSSRLQPFPARRLRHAPYTAFPLAPHSTVPRIVPPPHRALLMPPKFPQTARALCPHKNLPTPQTRAERPKTALRCQLTVASNRNSLIQTLSTNGCATTQQL